MTKDPDAVPTLRGKSQQGPIEVEAVPIEPSGRWGGSSGGYSGGQAYDFDGSDGSQEQARGPWVQYSQRTRIVRVPSWVVLVPVVLMVAFVVMLLKVFGLFLLLALGMLLLILRLNSIRIAVAQWLIRQALKRR
jgi:hypothetical protein